MPANPLEYLSDAQPKPTGPVRTLRRERRHRNRNWIHWPVRILRADGHAEVAESTTRDLSSEGFYCFSKTQLVAGELVRGIITIPAHDSGGRVLALHCWARVLRVEPAETEGLYGTACRIEDYHFSHSPDAGLD